MADSLVLTGVKDVKKHTGTEMMRLSPKGGGDTFRLKCWWLNGQVSTTYVTATVFNVTTAAGTVKLAIDSSAGTNLRIDHDGAFNFTFYHPNEVSRAALFTDDFQLIEHYVFPKISGGQIMTVTPPGAAVRPTAPPPPKTIGTVTLTGEVSPTDASTETYAVAISGDADDATYVLASSEADDTVAGLDVTFDGEGARTLTVTVTATASDTGATGTLIVTVTA